MQPEACSHKYLEELEIGLCCLSCGAMRNFTLDTSDTSPTLDTQSHEEYQYTPLNPDLNEIRLLVLLPGAETEPISCRIITVELESAPIYSAVSYTWATEDGDASKRKSIQVYTREGSKDRKHINVTMNCDNALRQLQRNHAKGMLLDKGIQRHVWIDAICINQDRISERNHQVSIMDRIYKNAIHVDICIQASGQEYQGAMELLNPIKTIRTEISSPEENLPEYDQLTLTYILNENQPGLKPHVYLVQLARLFGLRYFSRVWVVQEVLLAQNVFLHVNNKVEQLREEILRSICDICTSRSVSIPWLSRWISVWNQAPGIILCLNMSLNCSASDLRDQVFAITGLLHPCTRAIIRIDYLLSLDEVLATAVIACIAECGDLDVLCYARLPKDGDRHNAPSLRTEQFKAYLIRQGSKGVLDPSQMWERYDQDRFCSPSFPKVVMRTGCKRCGPPNHHVASRDSMCAFQWASSKSSSISTFERSNRPVPQNQILPCLEVYAYSIDTCTKSTDQRLNDFIGELEAGAHSPSLSGVFHNLLKAHDRGLKDLITELKIAKDKMWASIDYTVFYTRHSVGFTSGHCSPRDIVFTIYGATHPFLLRPVGHGEFRIVGECYLWNMSKVGYLTNDNVESGGWMNFKKQKRFITIY
jgi:hypothetical protein